MLTTLSKYRRRSRLVIGITAFIIALLGTSTAFADTCSPVPGDETDNTCLGFFNECPAQAGGDQQIWSNGGATAWPQEAYATLTSYNPSPVYTASSAWVALEQNDQGLGLIAQIGWFHDTTSYNEYVFAQVTDGSGHFSPIHSFYTTPSGANYYFAERQSNGTFDLEWRNGAWLPGNGYEWGSDTTAFVGEVDSYDSSESPDDGDHFPGNQTTPVVYSNAQWYDQYGTDHTPNLSWYAGNQYNSAGYGGNIPSWAYLYYWSGSHFEIWDNRCH